MPQARPRVGDGAPLATVESLWRLVRLGLSDMHLTMADAGCAEMLQESVMQITKNEFHSVSAVHI